jgi:hypothetical protein
MFTLFKIVVLDYSYSMSEPGIRFQRTLAARLLQQ